MAKILSKISPKHKGVLCIISSAFCFAFMGAFVRHAGDLRSVQKSFFRNLVAFIFAAAILIRQKGSFLPQKKKQHRRTADTLSMRYARNTLQLLCGRPSGIIRCGNAEQNVAVLRYRIFGNVPSGTYKFSADARCNSRICRKSAYNKAEPCKSGACAVTARFSRRYGRRCGLYCGKVARHQRRKRTLYRVLLLGFSCLVTLPFLLFDFHVMTWQQWLVLLGAGLAAAGGQFSITAAYKFAPAKEISVYDYSQIIFSALLGFILFSQLPDIWSFIGYVIICGVDVAMFFYN